MMMMMMMREPGPTLPKSRDGWIPSGLSNMQLA